MREPHRPTFDREEVEAAALLERQRNASTLAPTDADLKGLPRTLLGRPVEAGCEHCGRRACHTLADECDDAPLGTCLARRLRAD